jgi:hypothetical protein
MGNVSVSVSCNDIGDCRLRTQGLVDLLLLARMERDMVTRSNLEGELEEQRALAERIYGFRQAGACVKVIIGGESIIQSVNWLFFGGDVCT